MAVREYGNEDSRLRTGAFPYAQQMQALLSRYQARSIAFSLLPFATKRKAAYLALPRVADGLSSGLVVNSAERQARPCQRPAVSNPPNAQAETGYTNLALTFST